MVAVGNGLPAMAADFRKERHITFPLYVDPSLKVYEAAGLKRGLSATFNAAVLAASARAVLAGHFQGMTQGDKWQQGGTFVVLPGGKVAFRHISGFAGDLPDNADVLQALERERRR